MVCMGFRSAKCQNPEKFCNLGKFTLGGYTTLDNRFTLFNLPVTLFTKNDARKNFLQYSLAHIRLMIFEGDENDVITAGHAPRLTCLP